MTSSLIPTVKWFFGDFFASSSNTPCTMAGVNSFEASPYRPPITFFIWSISTSAVITSQ